MKIINETLSDLKVYARKEYGLTRNVPILVLLISEEEHTKLSEIYKLLLLEGEKRGRELVDLVKREDIKHYDPEFFKHNACLFQAARKHLPKQIPLFTTMVKGFWEIPNFERYEYVIMIRRERLLDYSHNNMIISSKGELNDEVRKTVALIRLLTHEFLHVVEREKNVEIYRDSPEDDKTVTEIMSHIRYHNFQKALV